MSEPCKEVCPSYGSPECAIKKQPGAFRLALKGALPGMSFEGGCAANYEAKAIAEASALAITECVKAHQDSFMPTKDRPLYPTGRLPRLVLGDEGMLTSPSIWGRFVAKYKRHPNRI